MFQSLSQLEAPAFHAFRAQPALNAAASGSVFITLRANQNLKVSLMWRKHHSFHGASSDTWLSALFTQPDHRTQRAAPQHSCIPYSNCTSETKPVLPWDLTVPSSLTAWREQAKAMQRWSWDFLELGKKPGRVWTEISGHEWGSITHAGVVMLRCCPVPVASQGLGAAGRTSLPNFTQFLSK